MVFYRYRKTDMVFIIVILYFLLKSWDSQRPYFISQLIIAVFSTVFVLGGLDEPEIKLDQDGSVSVALDLENSEFCLF